MDTVILSHGHYDHSGGILAFAGKNPNARIYIRENAFEDFYHIKDHGRRYIGIDKEIKKLEQVVIAGSDLRIDEELFLFTNVTGRRMWPEGNRELKVVKNGELLQDDFSHEQYLIIQSEEMCIRDRIKPAGVRQNVGGLAISGYQTWIPQGYILLGNYAKIEEKIL